MNNTHKSYLKIGTISNSANKTIANHIFMVYACMRYPISVSHTVLVQNIWSHAARGNRQAGDTDVGTGQKSRPYKSDTHRVPE